MYEPQIDDLFYATCTRRIAGAAGLFGGSGLARPDNSYAGHVFRAAAKDDHAVVAYIAWSQYSYGEDKPVLLRRSDFTFSPVAPEVFAALIKPLLTQPPIREEDAQSAEQA